MRRILSPLGLLVGLTSSTAQFTAPELVLTCQEPGEVRAYDMDGDGDLDLVRLSPDAGITWHVNLDGLGSFGTGATVVGPDQNPGLWEVADLSGDGALDLLFVSGSEQFLRWALNDGSGGFALQGDLLDLNAEPALSLGALSVTELNGDGWKEVVVTAWDADNGARILFAANIPGIGFGPFTEIGEPISGEAPSYLRVGDFDLSGGNDLLFQDGNNTVFVLRNIEGDGTVWEGFEVFQSTFNDIYSFPQLIDVDGDGDMDLAEAGFPSVHWLENILGESGTMNGWQEHQLQAWTTAGPGAFGRLGCGIGAGYVSFPLNPSEAPRYTHWLPALGDFAYSQPLSDFPASMTAFLADVDGDGHDDLFLHADGAWQLLRNTLQAATEEPELPVLDPLCKWGAEVSLPSALPSDGQWSGPGVFQNQLLRSSLTGTGTFTLGYSAYAAEGCPVGATAPIQVIEQPAVTPSIAGLQFCSSEAPIQLISQPAATAWLGVGNDGVFNPASFQVGGFGGYVLAIFEDWTGEQCANEIGPVFVQQAVPGQIVPAGPFCVNNGAQLITATGTPPDGVSWSGDIVSWNSTGATFLPNQGAGAYEVILHVEPTGPNTCGRTDTLVVIVSDQFPQIAVAAVPVLCGSGDSVDLTAFATPTGGTWAGPGVNNGSFDPSQVPTGSYLITYTVTEAGCSSSQPAAIKVMDAAEVTPMTGLEFCGYDGPGQFTAFPDGGTWNSPVDSNGSFDPLGLAPGTYPVVYTWQGSNGCELVNEELFVSVLPTTVPTIDPIGILCSTGPAVPLTSSLSGTWGGATTWEGDIAVLNPSALGPGTWTVTLTAAAIGECAGTATEDVLIEICSEVPTAQVGTLRAWPNPTNGEFWVELGGHAASSMDLLDATGRVALGLGPQAAGSLLRLNLAQLPEGAYFLRIATLGTEPQVVRVVKL